MNTFTELIHPKLLEIEQSGLLSNGQIDFLRQLYRFHPCTLNELIEKVRLENPERSPQELMGLNKHPKNLKDNGTIRVKDTRKCNVRGTSAQVLEPTFELPCDKGYEVFDEKYIISTSTKIEAGMGTVMFGTDKNSRYPVAIKMCNFTDPRLVRRFKEEVELMEMFNDTSEVVSILASNLDHNPPYFVMPIADGGDLRNHIDRIRTDVILQKDLFNKVLNCVAAIHVKGVLHRDLKPDNFLIFSHDNLKVIDLGIARSLEKESLTRVTVTGAQGGTEEYAPPEFYDPEGFKTADATWDIFSLGKTFYKLLTGKNPFYMRNDGSISPAIYMILTKCTQIDRKDRYQTIEELRTDLNQAYDISISLSLIENERAM